MPASLPNPTCRICRDASGRSQRLHTFACRGPEVLQLYRCGACACEFLDPQPSEAWLNSNYAGYFAKRRATVERPKLAFFTGLLKGAGLDLSSRHVLEVGAAEGDGVLALHSLWPDCRITALDGHPDSVPFGQSLPCRYIHQPVEAWLNAAGNERFDACLLFDVLEHLRDPVTVLRRLVAEHLNPGAVVLATFPNPDGLSRRLLGRLWPHYTTEHLYYLSRAGTAALGGQAGLQTRRLVPLPKRLPLAYVLDVASHFGPPAVRWAGRCLRRVTPRHLDRLELTVVMGEWLWIAERPPDGAMPSATTSAVACRHR